MGRRWKQWETLFGQGGSKITVNGDCSREIKRCLLLGRKAMTNLDSIIKKQKCYFANKGPSSQSYGFSSSYIWMRELDHRESWAPKSWCFWTVVLEKTLENPLDCKEVKPVKPKGNQSWIFIGRTDAEVETAIIWTPDEKKWLTGKDPEVRKVEGGRKRRRQRMRWLDDITDTTDMSLRKLLGIVNGKETWRAAVHGIAKVGHVWVTDLNWTNETICVAQETVLSALWWPT